MQQCSVVVVEWGLYNQQCVNYSDCLKKEVNGGGGTDALLPSAPLQESVVSICFWEQILLLELKGKLFVHSLYLTTIYTIILEGSQ